MKDPRNLLIVALVAVAAFLAGSGRGDNRVMGQGYPGGTADSNNSMVAVTGTIGSGMSVLYVIDTDHKHLAVYMCRAGKTIELIAARKIEWDLKIEEFHDESVYSPTKLRQRFFGGDKGDDPKDGGVEMDAPDGAKKEGD